jgi:hypothetical protein
MMFKIYNTLGHVSSSRLTTTLSAMCHFTVLFRYTIAKFRNRSSHVFVIRHPTSFLEKKKQAGFFVKYILVSFPSFYFESRKIHYVICTRAFNCGGLFIQPHFMSHVANSEQLMHNYVNRINFNQIHSFGDSRRTRLLDAIKREFIEFHDNV